MKLINEYCKGDQINLHLGCGGDYRTDYINIDYYEDTNIKDTSRGTLKADLLIDIKNIDNYVDASSVDKILLIHVLEHFTRWDAIDLLKKFFLILKPDGVLEMEHPDLDGVINFYLENKEFVDTPIGKLNIGRTQFYGNQWDCLHYETHRYLWTKNELRETAEDIGFKIIELNNDTLTHYPKRDMRVVLKKTRRDMNDLKLNLGSNDVRIEGFLNVDIRAINGVDIVDDVCILSKIDNNTVSKIVAHNILEHIAPDRTVACVKNWVGKLILFGTLEIGVPDGELIFNRYKNGVCTRPQYRDTPWEDVIHSIFGNMELLRKWHGEDAEKYMHHNLFNKDYLRYIMRLCGLQDIKEINSNHPDCITFIGTKDAL